MSTVNMFQFSDFVTLRNHKWNGVAPIFKIKIILRIVFSLLDIEKKNFVKNKANNKPDAVDWIIKYFIAASGSIFASLFIITMKVKVIVLISKQTHTISQLLDKIHIIGDTIRKMHLKRVTMSIILLI
jgi:hypothetical protein